MRAVLRQSYLILPTMLLAFLLAVPQARAASDEELDTFLEVTGFDVALESIRLSADTAPGMLGLDPDAFGSEWSRLVNEIFATEIMHDMGVQLLEQSLSDELLDHATDFYGSELGQRLVAVENKAHLTEEDEVKAESGEEIIAGLERIGSDRVEILRRLNAASSVEDTSVRALQEVQIRFLLAAASAGVIELRMDEADLRATMEAQIPEMREAMRAGALANAAYTYQAFSDADLEAYAEALETPEMQQVYELMNAVQFEIMANRFEAVAQRLSDMQPSQEL